MESSAPSSNEKHVKELIDSTWTLVEPWIKTKQYDNMENWMELFRSIMKIIQNTHKLPGIEKAGMAVDVIQGLVTKILKVVETDNAILKLLISEGGAAMLKAATKGFKEAMNMIDKDGDGEISIEEITSIFACCCPKKK